VKLPVVTLFEKYGWGARYVRPCVAQAVDVSWLDQGFASTGIEEGRYPAAGGGSEEGSGLAPFLGRFFRDRQPKAAARYSRARWTCGAATAAIATTVFPSPAQEA
jgi:hypothetical protein